MYYLGIDLGTSSIKVSLVDGNNLKLVGTAQSPAEDMELIAHRTTCAEQNPENWWENLLAACKSLKNKYPQQYDQVATLGISYQMHGLVVTDEKLIPLRPAIIWCDSRAVEIGNLAFKEIGPDNCLTHYLNSPGNFTASKWKWIRENEPSIYSRIRHVLLPGDYLAARLTGEVATTISGLSEGIMWDYLNHTIAQSLLAYYGLDEKMLPSIVKSFGHQGKLTAESASQLGLPVGVELGFRGGDQLTNALALGVSEPGQMAIDVGTSGAILGLTDQPFYDPMNRINTFASFNHSKAHPRYAVLACLNGAGIFYSWVRRLIGADTGFLPSFEILNDMASNIHPGSDHLRAYPFGNGAERMLHNQNPGGSFTGLNFNVHTPGHLLRATQEGIAFSLQYGMEIMAERGLKSDTIRAGHANLFLSPLFRQIFTNISRVELHLVDTNGSFGAAIGGAIGLKKITLANWNASIKTLSVHTPDAKRSAWYQDLYQGWKSHIALGL